MSQLTSITLHTKKVQLHEEYPVYVGYVKVTHYNNDIKASYTINPNPIMRLTRKDAKQDAQKIKESLH